jgi:hypothetical protein
MEQKQEAIRQWQDGAITYCELVAKLVQLLTLDDIKEHNETVGPDQKWVEKLHYF